MYQIPKQKNSISFYTWVFWTWTDLLTGKSFSEALILASTDLQYYKRFKYTICSEFVVFMYWTGKPMNNILSYCGLVAARIRASNKDLPVPMFHFTSLSLDRMYYLCISFFTIFDSKSLSQFFWTITEGKFYIGTLPSKMFGPFADFST